MDQGSTMKRSAVHNFAPTVTKFCVMWEGQALPHDTKFGNSRCEIVGRRVIFIWSLIHGLRWSGLIKVGPEFSKRDRSRDGIGVHIDSEPAKYHGSFTATVLNIRDTYLIDVCSLPSWCYMKYNMSDTSLYQGLKDTIMHRVFGVG